MTRIAALSLALALLFGGLAVAQDDTTGFTPAEESVEALYEAVLMSSSKLLQEFGPGDAALSFSGSFSAGGWSATLSGDYAGQPVNLAFSGTYDGASRTGSFTSNGTYGDGVWAGTGSWSYVQVDLMNLDMSWDSEATISWPWKLVKPDKHFPKPKRWARSVLPDGSVHVVDSGTYYSTIFGIPFGKAKQQISDWVYPPGGGGGIATVTVSLTDEAIHLTGYADFGTGGVGGKVNLSSVVVKDPVPVEVAAAAAKKAVE